VSSPSVATLRDTLHRDKTGAVKFIDRSGEIKERSLKGASTRSGG
jgi:hypothetical protein